MPKAALHNLGCKVNAYETEAMEQQLKERGYEIVPFDEKADVYIINTCSVTNIADRKSRQMLHRAKKLNPESVVVAAGCYVQVASEELKKDASVDFVIGNNKKAELADILDEYLGNVHEEEEAEVFVTDLSHGSDYEALHLEQPSDHTRAFIKVQDGCNQFCSYCIIPYARGRVRSRKISQVIEEVQTLAARGYKEVVLTGIHLSSYGLDFPEEERETLLSLIKAVHEVQGIQRIRLGSLEPRIITEEFARTISALPKMCPHFHLSLQSGCDATLERMNRRYTSTEYAEKCTLLRKYFDNPALTTDVIVGFPMETEEEFRMSRDFVDSIHFYETHIFKYSRRHGTKAAAMDGQLTESQKAIRSDEMLALNEKHSREYEEAMMGRELEILLEEEIEMNGEQWYLGHSKEYIKAVLKKQPQYGINDIVRVTADGFLENHIVTVHTS